MNRNESLYVKKNWLELASQCWERFQADGPGVVLIGHTPSGGEEFCYLTLKELVSHPHVDERLRALEELTQEYDPKKEIAVLFWRNSGRLQGRAYAFPDQEAPPQAYEHEKQIREEESAYIWENWFHWHRFVGRSSRMTAQECS